MTREIFNDLLNLEEIYLNISEYNGEVEDVYFHLSENGVTIDRELHLYNKNSSQPCRNVYITEVSILQAIKEIKEICFY